MPVIFKTPTSQRVTMLDKDADFMLKTMKTSGNIPGALFTEALPEALKDLQNRIELEGDTDNTDTDNDDDSSHVGLNTKALPLIQLLQKAIEQNEKLMWEKG